MMNIPISMSSVVCAVLVAVVVYKLVSWYRRYKAWAAVYDVLPGSRDVHWFWGNLHLHPGPGDEAFSWALKNNELYACPTGLSRFWLSSYRCSVDPTNRAAFKAILKCSAHVARKPRGPGTIYEIAIPWLGEGLLIANGDRWERSRRLLTPAFHFDILQPYVKVFNECTDILLRKIQVFAEDKQTFEAFQHVGLCSLDIICRCAFSYQTDCQIQGQRHPYVNAVHRLTALWMDRALNPLLYLDWIFFNFTFKGREFLRLCKYVHSVSEDIISKRKEALKQEGPPTPRAESGKHYLDFLDVLLTARDDDGVGMNDLDIRTEVDTFLFEGHDTTTSAIRFIMLSLAEHPDIQQKCREEVDAILDGRNSDEIEWNDLSKLEYLAQCIKEGLRLHTPVFFIQRQLSENFTINGYTIPAGTYMGLNIYNLHHNNDVWGEDHMEYKPERFSPDNVAKMEPFSFIPFSGGQRNCIGQNFAMNEIKVTIARLLRRFMFEVEPGHKVRKMMGGVMRTENGILLQAKLR